MPPGTHGLTPSLALRYSSGTGNGIFGVGWSITGLSAISRCNKTIAQDGFANAPSLDVSDGYCLDGNRLRLTGGTYGTAGSTYQTEVEVFSRVTAQSSAGNGPAWWEVRGKDGLIYEYGNTADSRIETVNSSTARLWALNRIKDRTGNYIDVEYYEDTSNGSFRPKEIRYTGNATLGFSPTTKVSFVYETVSRPDPIYAYHFGINGTSIEGKINEFNRIDRIDIIDISSATTVRTYELSYDGGGAGGRSRLSSIQECRAGDCLSATTLQWISGTSSWATSESSAGVTTPNLATVLIGDINGDGRDDVVYSSSATSGGGTWFYMLGTDTGYATAVNTGITNWNQANAQRIEWNGDDLMDVLVPCNGAATWCVLQSSGSGFTNINTGTAATGFSGQVLAADFDGDGRDDLVRIMDSTHLGLRLRGASGFGSETTAWTADPLSNTTITGNFSTMIAMKLKSLRRRVDINGDGREDFLLKLRLADPGGGTIDFVGSFFGNTSSFVGGEITGSGPTLPSAVGDFNGDGLSDFLFVGPTVVYAVMGQGTSFSNTIVGPSVSGLLPGFLMAMDYDGDGLDDIVVQKTSPADWHVSRSTGSGFGALTDLGLSSASTNTVGAADFNGDGLADLTRRDSTGLWKFRGHNGVFPDFLHRVTDGFSMYCDFNYSTLTAGGSTYTKGSGAAYPTREYQGPMYVVSSYSATDGTGGTYSMTYSYQQARSHLQGRGFLGFSKRTTTDSRNAVRAEETYLQDPTEYQAIGAPSLVQIKQSSGTLMRQTTNTWNKVSYSSGFTERRFPYLQKQVLELHEVGGIKNGNTISTATTTNSVDSTSGTVTSSVTDTVEDATGANGLQPGAKYTTQVSNPSVNLLNDTTNWCIGRPGQTQFINTHDQTGGAQITRTLNRSWDGVKCRETQEIIEPGDAQWQVTTDITYDDAAGESDPDVGNITKLTATGIGMTGRVTRASYGTDGRFLSSTTNAASETTQFAFDTKVGTLTSITDPNGLQTAFDFDSFGRRTKETRPDGTRTTYDYFVCTSGCDSRVRMYVVETPRDTSNAAIRTNTYYFDALDRPLYEYRQMLGGGSSITTRNYDSLG
ncbi:MAG TPA: FG-GAP-like repeat-containing protein, partial [Steroidobacteraceae bacterium]|nr:FG-GAP-like repeat-containing protein [Steroidobacteraceae bacterium]